MHKIKFIGTTLLLLGLLICSSDLSAQAEQNSNQNRKAVKHPNGKLELAPGMERTGKPLKKRIPKVPRKVTPEQIEKLKAQKKTRSQLSNEQKAKLKEKAASGNKFRKINSNNSSTPMTKLQASSRKKDVAKAKAISKSNLGIQRVKAGNRKLAQAKTKLSEMKSSGKYTPAQIQQKEQILKRYEAQLQQLDKATKFK